MVNSGQYLTIRLPSNSPFISMATPAGYVKIHRLEMAKAIGRPLTTKEIVHHVNGDIHDNRISNLQITNAHNHRGLENFHRVTQAEVRTIQEIADKLKVNQRTIRRWIKAGKLNAVKLSCNTIRITDEEYKRLLNEK